MTTIWKYPLELVEAQKVDMPAGATPLHVAVQGDQMCVWMMVDTYADRQHRTFYVVGTNHPVPNAHVTMYIGTVHLDGFVWHVFTTQP